MCVIVMAGHIMTTAMGWARGRVAGALALAVTHTINRRGKVQNTGDQWRKHDEKYICTIMAQLKWSS